MTIVETKISIQLAVERSQDSRLLEAINTMLQESLDPEIMGYDGDKPLTKADLIKGALEAEEDIKQGRVYTTEEIKKRLHLLKK